MNLTHDKIKETINQLTESFHLEKNVFQKFVIIHKYINFLNETPLTKEVIQNIFNDTAATIDESYYELPNKKERNKVHGKNFWMYYTELERIHDTMNDFKKCKTLKRVEFDKLYLDFSEPYSEEILEFSLKVVNGYIFNNLDQGIFFNSSKKEGETWFDDKRSILYVRNFKILIAKQDKETNAHKILRYIFKDNKTNLDDNFFFSEIAEDVFEDLEYKEDKNSWRRYHRTCEVINEKIFKETKNIVDKFLLFNTGRKGYLKINPDFM